MLTVDDLWAIRLRAQRMVASGLRADTAVEMSKTEQIYYKEQNERKKRNKKAK